MSPTTSIAEAGFCVFDLETTGVDAARGDDIVQIGAVRVVARRLTGDAFETLADSGRAIPARATRVHGITREMVRGAPHPVDAIAGLAAFAGDAVWAAFAAGFDIGFLRLHRRDLPPILCVAELFSALRPGAGGATLEQAAAALGVALTGRHTAPGDARIAAELLLALLPEAEHKGLRNVGQLLAKGRPRLRH